MKRIKHSNGNIFVCQDDSSIIRSQSLSIDSSTLHCFPRDQSFFNTLAILKPAVRMHTVN